MLYINIIIFYLYFRLWKDGKRFVWKYNLFLKFYVRNENYILIFYLVRDKFINNNVVLTRKG